MDLFELSLSKLRDVFVESEGSRLDQRHRNGNSAIAVENFRDENAQHIARDLITAVSIFGVVRVSLDLSFLSIFDRALLVDMETPCTDDALLSAIVLFNLALMNHTIGVESGHSDYLQRARRMYSLTLTIVEDDNDVVSNCLLHLALLNNMAHIDAYLCRTNDMMDALEKIRMVLEVIDDQGMLNLIKDEDYMIFSMNAMFGNDNEFSVASAA